jgi:hypothetical protein
MIEELIIGGVGIFLANLPVAYIMKKDFEEQKEKGYVSSFSEYWSKGIDYFNKMFL